MNDNTVSVLLGNGDGIFGGAANYVVASLPFSVAVGDLNRDGKPDIAVANQTSGNVSILLGKGDGTFNAASHYPAGSSSRSVAVGDFNRDGKPDLAVANWDSNNVSILLGNGNGTFNAAVNYATQLSPKFVALGDFNNDGINDLAVANYNSSNISVLLGNGDGTFQAKVNYPTGTLPASIAMGDFNRDGKPDLAISHHNRHDISVLLNTSAPLPPTVAGVNPDTGNQGQTLNNVIITGTNFTGATTVNFGAGITVNSFTIDSNTQITASVTILSYASPGTRNVTVTTPAGTGTLTGGFTVNRAGQQTQSVNTATGSGVATFATSNGSISALTASASTACGALTGYSFPHGFFSYTIANLTPGATVTITITLPSNVSVGTKYYKCINGQWVDVTSLLGDDDGDTVLTLTITDGQLGDADGLADGAISDPGGPGIPVARAQTPKPKPKPFAESSSAPQMPEQFLTSPAKLSVKYLNVQPQQAQANQPVTVYANITNSGDESGSYTATLKINGQVEQVKTGRIGGNVAVPMKFEVLKDKPGIYNVDINGQQTSFIIIDAKSSTVPSKSLLLIGFIACAIGIVIVSVLLVLRRRDTY